MGAKQVQSLSRYLEDNSCFEALTGCLLWHGPRDAYGYGAVNLVINKLDRKAHRLSWQMHRGLIPDGMVVRHRCDNVACINPDHLELGTQLDNIADTVSRKRHNFGVRVPQSKLLPEQVAAIRLDGRSLKKIGADYGVCAQAIHAIKRGRTWRSV